MVPSMRTSSPGLVFSHRHRRLTEGWQELAAINAVALVSVDEEQVIDEADSVIDVDATEVPTGDSIDENAELITTVRAAITSSTVHRKVDLADASGSHERSRGRPGGVAACVGFDQNWASRDRASAVLSAHDTRAGSNRGVGTVGTFRTPSGRSRAGEESLSSGVVALRRPTARCAEILRKWGMMEMASSDQSRSAAHETCFSIRQLARRSGAAVKSRRRKPSRRRRRRTRSGRKVSLGWAKLKLPVSFSQRRGVG